MDSHKPSSASKLPVKRKTPHPSLHHQSISTLDFDDSNSISIVNAPPFKFHRIWTQPDEIRFLQGLLHSVSLGFSFPRDLHLFYHNFSNSMSQPYSSYQLSEKLRRLRKKFRITSSRISRGLKISALTLHDRNLFELSLKLWGPEYLPTSPFGKNSRNNAGLVGVKVNLQQVLNSKDFVRDDHVHYADYDFGVEKEGRGGLIGGAVARSALEVYDECLRDLRVVLVKQGVVCSDAKEGKNKDFERRWKEQRIAEMDVLSRRLRLVLEDSFNLQ